MVNASVSWRMAIPDGTEGAVRFEAAEADLVKDLIGNVMSLGWCVDDDLLVIPDHGRQILKTDHHGVVHVNFASESRVEEYVRHMARAGFLLPTDTPDDTFRRPRWMGNLVE